MINYNKNKLINECLRKYYETFAHTLDTADYVPEEFNNKILAYIFKNMKKQFKKIDREDKRYQREQRKKLHKGNCAPCNTAETAAKTEEATEKPEAPLQCENTQANPDTACGGDTGASL